MWDPTSHAEWLASDDDYSSTPLERLWGSTPPYQLQQAASRLPAQDVDSLRRLVVSYRNAITTGDVMPQPPRPINLHASLQPAAVQATIIWTCTAPQPYHTINLPEGYDTKDVFQALTEQYPPLRSGITLRQDRFNRHTWHAGPSGLRGGTNMTTALPSTGSTMPALTTLARIYPLPPVLHRLTSLWSYRGVPNIPAPPPHTPSATSSSPPSLMDMGQSAPMVGAMAVTATLATAHAVGLDESQPGFVEADSKFLACCAVGSTATLVPHTHTYVVFPEAGLCG